MSQYKEASLRISLFQTNSGPNIENNKIALLTLIKKALETNSDLWIFPECTLYRNPNSQDIKAFNLYSTIIPWFQSLAKTHKKWIIVGSFFFQRDNQDITNSLVVIDPTGNIDTIYDKMHLFDVTVDNTSFDESAQFTAGTTPKTTTINGFKIGLSICFDLRFPSLYQYYRNQGCHIIVAPSSFTSSTGKLHWHTLCRARAIETQSVVLAPNQVGFGANNAPTYGHSLIVDSLGRIIEEGSGYDESILTTTVTRSSIESIRQRFKLNAKL